MTIFSSPSLTSSQPPVEYQGYLQQLWSLQRIRYELNWQLYTGEKWLEIDTRKDNSESQRKYRLGVNDMALACNMHAQLLFGEVRDSSDPLVSFKVSARRGQTLGDGVIETAQDFLDELWSESAARRNQFVAGLSSQVTGGVFWRVRYDLSSDNPFDLYPFKFEPIHADYVFPVFSPASTRLSEVFVRYQLPREAARAEWGQWSNDWPNLIEYREHWTSARAGLPGTLSITVGTEGTRKEIKTEQNPFGFVPFVYIPHIPSNGFFGIPLAEWAGASDLAEEYNERLANTGDILKQNAYAFGVLKNHPTGKLNKQPFRLWKGGPVVVDIGSGLPDGKQPELEWFDAADLSAGTMTYLDGLKKELRMSMAIPPVAVGEDEGSQRSSLTLTTRMFPMKSHVLTERWMWTSPMEDLNRMALQMAMIKQIGDLAGIDVARVTITPNWAPMLPRDRAELVNELVQRQGVGHIAPVDALERYEDIPTSEVENAYKRIQEHMQWSAELNKPAEVGGVPVKPIAAKEGTKDAKK